MKKLSELLHDYFAPDAAVSAYQEVARFPQLKCTARNMDGHSVCFDLFRRMGRVQDTDERGAVHGEWLPLSVGEITGSCQRAGKFGSICCYPVDASIV